MHREIRLCLALAALTLCTCAASAHAGEAPFPVVGAYGFDWLKPARAHCTQITEARARQFATCRFADSGAFGLPLAYHTCPVNKGSELIVLRDKAACKAALETMQANAP